MKLTVHGHRPACFRSPELEQRNEPNPNTSENVKKINLGLFKLKIHMQSARQASLIAQLSSQQEGRAEYIQEWRAWAEAADTSVERGRRSEAVNNMTACLDNNGRRLNLATSGLTSLPDRLPPSLEELYLAHNRLSVLPELPGSLHTLDVAQNQLTSLSSNLPPIRFLHIEGNRLTTLPPNLPISLHRLNVSRNQITSLPEDITARLTSECTVNLEGNPLPDSVRDHLQEAVTADGYNGPTFHFSMATGSDNAQTRPLPDAVSQWYGEGERRDVKATWSAIANEDGAAEFSQFLDRLRRTVNYSNPAFKASVVEWLTHLSESPELRAASFLISVGATESCEDRVSLTFNDMKKARLAVDVEAGRYNERVPELVALAKGMFRLDKLEKIARQKVRSLRFVDEIEVYLAYQVKLRERLGLPLDTSDMRFFNVSSVTEVDLQQAEDEVKASESTEFMSYLSTDWQPWQSVLKTLNGEAYERAQEELRDAIENVFPVRLQERLQSDGLENDSDAQRIVGPQVQAEITHEINNRLTLDFLKTQNLGHLLQQ